MAGRALVRRGSLSVLAALSIVAGCTSGPGAVSQSVAPASPSASAVEPMSSSAPSPSAGEPAPSPVPSVDGMLESTTELVTEAPADAIRIEMFGPPPQFRPKSLTASAGDVVFYLENGSPSGQQHGTHNLNIGRTRDAPLAASGEVPGGRRAAFTIHGLEPGEYIFWCSLFGHASLGQEGTLTVG